MAPRRLISLSIRLAHLAVAAALGLLAVPLGRTPLFEQLEAWSEDVRVTQMARRESGDPQIVVLTFDGANPPNAADLAALVRHCADARVVGLNLLPAADDAAGPDLAIAVREAGNVVCAAAVSDLPTAGFTPEGELALRFSLFVFGLERLQPPEMIFLLPPFRELFNAAAALGFVNYFPGPDGRVRRYPLFVNHEGLPYPSFGLSLANQALRNTNRIFYVTPSLDVQSRGMEVRADLSADFHMLFHENPHEHIAAAAVLDDIRSERPLLFALYPPEYFRDRLVLIGVADTGWRDDRLPTPLPGQKLHRVDLHATALDNLLHGNFFRATPGGLLPLLCVLLALPAWSLLQARPPLVFLASLLTLLAYVLVAMRAAEQQWLLPIGGPATACALSLLAQAAWRWDRDLRRARGLETLDRAKQQFTDMLVHDLKGQAGNLELSLNMLGGQLENPPAARTLLRAMEANNRRMLTQIHALLDIRRMQEGRMPLHREAVAIHPLLDRLVKELTPSLDFAKLRPCLDFSAEVARPVDADPAVLQRLFTNLLLNAMQYGAAGSDLRVSTRALGEGVEVSILNQGRNLPEGAKHTLFQPFHYFALPKANTRAVQTGLGLAFCKLAADAHQGRIELDSPLADGTDGVCARVWLPWAPLRGGDGR